MLGDDDPLVCLCRHVRESVILAAMGGGSRDLESLHRETGAGTGCGDCVADLEDLLQEAG
ncbi:bacterioferritin-associated ferredoxin [Streptomyces nitrosporeus]|uniref:(2Fe-2S)-binding protein n=1 Tax=Streptomyces nitrosporeus TaxID=28894 RepID=UPI0039A3AEE8